MSPYVTTKEKRKKGGLTFKILKEIRKRGRWTKEERDRMNRGGGGGTV